MSEALPIEGIRAAFERHPEMTPLVVSAPTGSGKSTQIPRWCAARERLSAQEEKRRPRPTLIVEPRRVACRSLASRVADLEGVQLGAEVGYTVRDEDRSSDVTLIRFVTTGVALRLWEADQLRSYSAVIIDEFHERNLELDLLLALCQAHPHRPLIVMSATFAADRLAEHLCGVHLSGEGRRFEVGVEYRPHGNTRPSGHGLIEGLISLIDEAFTCAAELDARSRSPEHNGRDRGGDVLVFLPGKGEIHEAQARVEQRWRSLGVEGSYEVLPLHGGLSLDEQSRVFLPSSRRRLILATNVAETSLTVPGISVVIDSGLVRRTRYDRGRGALALVEVAEDSAEQRRGRAGRLGPGICFKMWSRGAALKPYTPPEIYRESLTSLLLATAACGVAPDDLPFVDPPKPEAVAEAKQVLSDLGAFSANPEGRVFKLSTQGEALFKLGVDVSLGRWLVEGLSDGPLLDLIDLVSALSCRRSIFMRGLAGDPYDDLRAQGCDAVGLIRAVRTPISQARRRHIHVEIWREARQHRDRLCRGLGIHYQQFAPADLDHDSTINRRALALALLRADPRCAYVSRARRRHEVWCGRGPELSLGDESGLALARTQDARLRPEALLVLDRYATVKGGRHAQHLITASMPIPLEWMRQTGLGDEKLGAAKIERGQLKIEVSRVFAKKVLETTWITPHGERAREALTRCLLAGQRWPKLRERVEHRLRRQSLSHQLQLLSQTRRGAPQRRSASMSDSPSELSSGVSGDGADPERWLLRRLEELGFEDSSDLELLEEADLLPDELPSAESAQLDKAFPSSLNLSDAHYVFHYEVARRRVIMEQVSGSRRAPPRVEWLPKCGGFEIRFKQGQHDSALRPRQRAR